jgi:hypothetical protein
MQRILHCCVLEHLRDLLNGRPPNLTGGLYSCLLLGNANFLVALQGALTPPACLFNPATSSRLPPEALKAFYDRMQGQAQEIFTRPPRYPYDPSQKFEAVVFALHVGGVRGDTRLLTHPPAEEESGYADDDWEYAFEDDTEEQRLSAFEGDRERWGSGGGR